MSNYVVSFRITHPIRDLGYVCNALKREPIRIWMAGEPRVTPKGRPLSGAYSNSYCCIRLAEADCSLSETLTNFVLELEQSKETFKDIVSSGGRLAFFIFFESTHRIGEIIDWHLLKRIADLQISLEFD